MQPTRSVASEVEVVYSGPSWPRGWGGVPPRG